MTVACQNGHLSETTDYCDQCGARIDGPAAGATAPPAPHSEPASTPTPPPGTGATVSTAPDTAAGVGPDDERCPVCQTPRVGDDRFCEGCGYDYTVPPPPPPAAGPPLTAASGAGATGAWEAVAEADRDYFDRVAAEGVSFPAHCPPRLFVLAGDQVRVGRRSTSRGIQPEIDLTGAPEDSAISHLHCILIEEPDGSYSLVDPGSTNGTTLNDDPTPLMANHAVALADGDRIHVGAWTTITIRARAGASNVVP